MKLYYVVFLLFPLFGIAQINPNYQLEDKVNEADLICEGRIMTKSSFRANDGDIYTRYRIRVSKWFKGHKGTTMEFSSLGGVFGNEALEVCPSFHPAIGTPGIFFFRQLELPNQEELTIPVSSNQSWISIDEDYGEAYEDGRFVGPLELAYDKIIQHTQSLPITVSELSLRRDEDAPEVVTLTNISPLTTQAGRQREVTITGSGFGNTKGSGSVLFRNANGTSGTINIEAFFYTSWSDTEIVCEVPEGAGSGSYRVRNDLGQLSPISGQTLNVTYNVNNVSNSEPRLVDQKDDGNGGYIMKYSDNTANGGVDFTAVPGAVEAAERAVNTWTAGSSFALYGEEECGTSSIQNPTRDSENMIMFDSDVYDLDTRVGSSVLGIMRSYFSGCGNGQWEITEFDMVLRRDGNPNNRGGSVNWEYGPAAPSAGETDFESVILHEFGHAHGLGHVRVSGAVMFPSIIVGSTNRALKSSESTGGGYIHGESKGYTPPGCSAHGRYGDHDPNELCSLVLPLDLIGFTAYNYDRTNNIQWQTVNEIDHDHIILQYQDGSTWVDLEKFEADGKISNDVNSYHFDHNDLWPGVYSYRLKIVAIDGSNEFSKVISAEVNGIATEVNLSSHENRIIIEGFIQEEFGQFRVHDINGRLIYQRDLFGEGRSFEEQIDPTNWAKGIYLLSVTVQNQSIALMKYGNI